VFASLCGLGDEGDPHACDDSTTVTWCFAGIALGLSALACAWPRRALRYALWATPAAMLASVFAFAL
jgi:hypothetical protein